MSESAPEATSPSESPATGETNANPDTAKLTALTEERDKLREEVRKFRGIEDRMKAAMGKAKEYDRIKAETLTMEERLTAQVQELTGQLSDARNSGSEAQRELAMFRAAVKHGIGEEDMVFLKGVSSDDLEKAAEALSKRLGAARVPGFDGGPRTSTPAPTTMGDFLKTAIDNAHGRRR